jgi:hypothetical protein
VDAAGRGLVRDFGPAPGSCSVVIASERQLVISMSSLAAEQAEQPEFSLPV